LRRRQRDVEPFTGNFAVPPPECPEFRQISPVTDRQLRQQTRSGGVGETLISGAVGTGIEQRLFRRPRERGPNGPAVVHGGRSVGESRSVIRGDRPRCRSTFTSPARSREARARRNVVRGIANRSRRDRPTFTSGEPVKPRRNQSSTATAIDFPPHPAAASSQSSGTGPLRNRPLRLPLGVPGGEVRGARFGSNCSGSPNGSAEGEWVFIL
jgi:hypothetical protein